METWIHFSAAVNENTSGRLIVAITTAVNEGSKKLNLLLNTNGGTVLHGRGVYNFLRSLPIEISTFNLGQVDSIGGVMYLAGDERFVVPNGSFLIHPVVLQIQTAASWPERLIQEKLFSLKQDRESISSVYAERTGMDLKDFEELMLNGTTLTAIESVSKKIATAIKVPEISPDTQICSIVD